jgi:hypothetical protein
MIKLIPRLKAHETILNTSAEMARWAGKSIVVLSDDNSTQFQVLGTLRKKYN